MLEKTGHLAPPLTYCSYYDKILLDVIFTIKTLERCVWAAIFDLLSVNVTRTF